MTYCKMNLNLECLISMICFSFKGMCWGKNIIKKEFDFSWVVVAFIFVEITYLDCLAAKFR